MIRQTLLYVTFAAIATASSYTVIVVPTPNGFTGNSVVGINDSGQVAGYGNNGTANQAFIGNAPIPYPTGWVSSVASAINSSGQVTGYNAVSASQGFIGTASGSTLIPLPPSWTSAVVYGVNDSGQVAGTVYNGTVNSAAFVGTTSSGTVIPAPAGYVSAVGFAVNSSGQVAGSLVSPNRGFITTSGSTVVIPLPSGWTAASATALNDSGQVAGVAVNSSSEQAYIGSATAATVIPLPAGATQSIVYSGAINNSGTVVGFSNAGGWIWSAANGTVLLNSLVPAGWSVSVAIAINNNGAILAYATENNGPNQPVVLSPSACGFSLTPSSFTVNASAENTSATIGIANGCSWQASSNSSWLSITSGASGSGNGTVAFSIAANTGTAARVGTLTVAGQTVTVTQAPPPPAAPVLTSPANGALAVSTTPTLTWGASTGALSYNVYFGTSSTPSLVTNVTTTSYAPTGLVQGQKYYWQIVATNSGGTAASAVWAFTTGGTVSPTSVSPAAGTGATQTFTFTFTDQNGYADLSVLDVLISTFLDGQTACYFALAPTSATTGYLYLVDNAGDGGYAAGTPMPLPSNNVLPNSQCSLNGTGSSISASGNTLTLTLSITFASGFAGNKAFYMAARSSTQNSGWQALGSWDVPGSIPAGPAVGGMSPARSTSTGQTYSFTFTDSNGFSDLFVVDILNNSFLDGIAACYVAYVPTSATTGYVYLVDDAGDGGYTSGSPALLSSGTVLQNSQCSINTSASSASASGNTLTLNLNIAYSGSFTGDQVFYLAARNNSTGNSGWQAAGSVTVP